MNSLKLLPVALTALFLCAPCRAAGLDQAASSALEQAALGLRDILHSDGMRRLVASQSREDILNEALRGAIRRADIDEMHRVLRLGADPNAFDGYNPAPLAYAAQYYDLPEVVEALLAAGAKVDGKGVCAYQAIHYAASAGHLEVVKTLVKHHADVDAQACLGHTPLADATQRSRYDVAAYLLQEHADPNVPLYDGKTPLLLACAPGGDVEIAKALLQDKRANVNAADRDGMTALKLAVKRRGVELVKLLLAAPGIDVNDNSGGVTALFLAKVDNSAEIIGLLEKAGARD